MTEALSMFKKRNPLNAKVILKVKPAGWSKPTLLIRLHTKTGNEILMTCLYGGLSLDENLLEDRIYDFQFPGSSVKRNTLGIQHGIVGSFDLVCKFPPKVKLAEEAWPTVIHYNIRSFITLTDIGVDDWFDIMGRVQKVGSIEERIVQPKVRGASLKAYSLQSRTIVLRSGEFHEDVELLYPHINLNLKIGDVLALRGCKMKEYNMKRKVGTSFMTIVEVNPVSNKTLGKLPKEENDSPSKKAIRGSSLLPISISDLVREMENFRSAYATDECTISAKREMTVFAKIEPFTERFFQFGRPLYGNNDACPKMRIMAVLLGSEGRVPFVTIWDEAAKTIFRTDGNTLAGLWEKCEHENGTEKFLEVLNSVKDKEFRFGINIRLWKADGAEKNQVKVQVHVQWAEDM